MSQKLPLEKLYHWENVAPNETYLFQPIKRKYIEYSWSEVANQARKMASYLQSKGYPPGSNIAIISKNCAHWMMADFAIWMAGYTSVPLFPNLTADSAKKILDHSESKLVFIGKLDSWDAIKDGISDSIDAVSFPDIYQTNSGFKNWDEIISENSPIEGSPTRSFDEIATIIYTSGTTGMPKGVVHKFKQFSYAADTAVNTVGIYRHDRFLSYLPLSHCAERLLVETCSVYIGGHVYFAESLDTFAEDLKNASPSVFLAVPRIWNKFQDGIRQKLPQKKLDVLLKIPFISSLIKKKIKAGLGLQNCHLPVTGAAPISADLLAWYEKLGLNIQNAYGMTENLAFSHYMRADNIEKDAIGQPWPGTEVKITDQGEITVKNDAMMEGYFKEPEMTAETIIDGYLHTGDKGTVDANGMLRITGRVKDLFKTSKGKYVAPSPIELLLSKCEYAESVCVVGQGLPQPIALSTLNESAAKADKNDIVDAFSSTIEATNSAIDGHERLAKGVILKEGWTVENGFLTPTQKIKRNVVEDSFSIHFEKWAAKGGPKVIWQ